MRHALQVSCASEGAVAITVGQTEVRCQSAGQEVGLLQHYYREAMLQVYKLLHMHIYCVPLTHSYHPPKQI